MKRTFSIAILFVLALSFFNAAPTEFSNYNRKIAIINFTTEVVDYGTVTQNSDGTRLFTFTNTGDAPYSNHKGKNDLWLYRTKLFNGPYYAK